VGGVSTGSESAATDTSTDTEVDLTNVNYQDHVLPIFEEHCAECHGAEDPEEGLELTRYRTAIVGSMNGPVIEPGDPDNSYLVELIVKGEMPKRGDPLSPDQIDIITAWIEAGAPEN
jgi:mono/diheme cytochrome c family protein